MYQDESTGQREAQIIQRSNIEGFLVVTMIYLLNASKTAYGGDSLEGK